MVEERKAEKVPIISLDVALPGGDQENLLIYDDDNLDDIVEVFSLNHRKSSSSSSFNFILLIELDQNARRKLLNRLKDVAFDSQLVEGVSSLQHGDRA